MAKRDRSPGLIKRGGVWHVDKQVFGRRLCESTGTSDLKEAEAYLSRRIEQLRQIVVYGAPVKRTFTEAAVKYLDECTNRSIARDADALKRWQRFIGDLTLDQIHMGTLNPFIHARRLDGAKSGTVRRELAVVRRILNLSARLWRDDQGRPWLATVPMILMPDWEDGRKPYPLDWDEQTRLLSELPPHLSRMALFKVNVGAREQEVCRLRWSWEIPIPELRTSVFYVPDEPRGESGMTTKNKEDRILVLNAVARSVIDDMRGQHRTHVFAFHGHPVTRIYNGAWRRARERAGLPQLRVHDLRHTFGRRLRAAGVPLETRKVLLGHKNGDVTTHYSAAEIAELIDAVERVAGGDSRKSPALTLLKLRRDAVSA